MGGQGEDLDILALIAWDRGQVVRYTQHKSAAISIHRKLFGDADPRLLDPLSDLALAVRQRPLRAALTFQSRRLRGAQRSPKSDEQQRFLAPELGSYRLDVCLRRGAECGEPAAGIWCRQRGYHHASAWEQDRATNASQPTLLLGEGRLCSGNGCQGFASITCARARANPELIAAAEAARRAALEVAAEKLEALRAARASAKIELSSPAVAAVERWLLAHPEDPGYLEFLDLALARVRRSLALALSPTIHLSPDCAEPALATTKGIAFCQSFFDRPFECQREVITRAAFIAGGLEPGADTCGPEQALENADKLTQLVFDLALGETGGCVQTVPGELTAVDTATEWSKCTAYLSAGDAAFAVHKPRQLTRPDHPRSMAAEWGLSWADGVDAALRWSDGKIYLFEGLDYMRIDPASGRPDPGFPRRIADDWPGLWPDGIDAAVAWSNGFAYFFRGSEYARISVADPARRVHTGYPMSIAENWPGLWPDGVDAAVMWDDRTAYFFKAGQFMLYDIGPPEGARPPRSMSCCWK